MRHNTPDTIKRAERFQIILIGEGILVGAIAGLIVLLYRICLEYAGKWLKQILAYASGNPVRMAGWFAVLLLLAWIVAKLVQFEPMISGSGIPQLEGEMVGKVPRRLLMPGWRTGTWKRRPIDPAWRHGRKRGIQRA